MCSRCKVSTALATDDAVNLSIDSRAETSGDLKAEVPAATEAAASVAAEVIEPLEMRRDSKNRAPPASEACPDTCADAKKLPTPGPHE